MNHQALDALIVFHLVGVLNRVQWLLLLTHLFVRIRLIHLAQVPDLEVAIMTSCDQLQACVREAHAADGITMSRGY